MNQKNKTNSMRHRSSRNVIRATVLPIALSSRLLLRIPVLSYLSISLWVMLLNQSLCLGFPKKASFMRYGRPRSIARSSMPSLLSNGNSTNFPLPGLRPVQGVTNDCVPIDLAGNSITGGTRNKLNVLLQPNCFFFTWLPSMFAQ